MKAKKRAIVSSSGTGYDAVLTDVVHLIEAARRAAARSVNAVMTATYWAIGRRIVEHEQAGAPRAIYGEKLLKRLAIDLTAKLGRGFSERNLEQMRRFFLTWPISQTASAKSVRGWMRVSGLPFRHHSLGFRSSHCPGVPSGDV